MRRCGCLHWGETEQDGTSCSKHHQSGKSWTCSASTFPEMPWTCSQSWTEFFFSPSYLLDQPVRWSHANIRSPAVRLAKGRPSVKSDLSKAWNHQPRAFWSMTLDKFLLLFLGYWLTFGLVFWEMDWLLALVLCLFSPRLPLCTSTWVWPSKNRVPYMEYSPVFPSMQLTLWKWQPWIHIQRWSPLRRLL